MSRTLLCVAALAMAALPSWAGQTMTETETLIQLNVQPMAAPRPALRFLLLPELKEMNPGNPIQNYLKCFAEQQNFFFKKEACDERDKLLVMPLKDLPARDLQDYGKAALRQADWAARLDKPDWQILLQSKTEGIGLLLPDVQQMRILANGLKVRFRAEVALHHYDDAVRTAKTMFALGRHMAEGTTLIGDLVGIAIAFVTIGPLEEMLEQPGCPNLYWALTNLPNPLISLEHGMQGERMLMKGEFRDLVESTPMSEEQLKKLIDHIDMVRALGEGNNKPKETTRAYLDARIKDEGLMNAARRRLIEAGYPEDRLKSYPADQVILLDEFREYEVRRDEVMKLANLPAWQFEALATQLKPSKEPTLIAELLVPALHKVRNAQGRLEQRIALLRHVEALRLYAAEHNGVLPGTLADVTVPLPDDPFTGKPFQYKLEGATAHLRGSPPRLQPKVAAYNVHYEITIQK